METTSLQKTNSRFLTGIIPANWVEVIFEYQNYYMIHVTGEATTDDEWENYVKALHFEFGEMFDEIYRLPEDELTFQVFLKKSNLNS